MAKHKRKPDFSKPKPQKYDVNEQAEDKASQAHPAESGQIQLQNEEAQPEPEADSDDWTIEDTKSDDKAQNSETSVFSTNSFYTDLPVVVIAGRPNVGKSTLFNRFMNRRLAIVDPTPGVTRDPVEATAFIAGKPVRLVDTGGYKLDRDYTSRESEMDDLVVEKTVQTIKKADRILLLLEAGTITGEDEEFIHFLRPYWDKLIVAVNKCEGGKGEDVAWNYLQYGFREILFISASHGDHISELARKITDGLDFSRVRETETEERAIRIAILGKPNTGKSTLANRLTHSEHSIVSDYAGTTRDVVESEFEYNGRAFEIMDTAGIRRKKRVRENVEYYSVNRAIKTLDTCDIVFLMIDAQEGLTDQDKKICALAYERGRGIIIVLNKWDTQEKSRKTLRTTVDYIKTMFGHMNWAPILPLSALYGEGIKDLMNMTLTLYAQLTRKIDTSALNKALHDWLFHYPPPASKAIHFKIRYMTQTGTNPVSFRIFCTNPDNVPENYVTYLKNSIRKDLGFDHIPVALDLNPSRKKWEERFISE